MKGWFSWHEIKEEEGPGELRNGIYEMRFLTYLAAWTVAHGHFLIMGGFHVVEPPEVDPTEANTEAIKDVPFVDTDTEKAHHGSSEKKPNGRITILTLEILRELVKDPDFDMQISAEDITDRSKGDALSKLIFILQSTWFILQCLGRRLQGLNLTHLELTTLALASLNGITFMLWWDKPLGAQAIVRVYLKRKMTESERLPLAVSDYFFHVLFLTYDCSQRKPEISQRDPMLLSMFIKTSNFKTVPLTFMTLSYVNQQEIFSLFGCSSLLPFLYSFFSRSLPSPSSSWPLWLT